MAAQIKKKVKALPPDDPAMAPNATDDMAVDPAMGEPMGKDMPGEEEPYGAQVLRRMHEDHGHLMKDYHQMHSLCENKQVKKLLHKDLEHKASHMDEIEGEFAKSYKDFPPLAGAEEEDTEEEKALDEDPDAAQPEEEGGDEPLAEDAGGEVKDMDTPDDAAVGEADDEREEDEPTGEEAFEASTKSLRKRYGGKPLPRRGKASDAARQAIRGSGRFDIHYRHPSGSAKVTGNHTAPEAQDVYDQLTNTGHSILSVKPHDPNRPQPRDLPLHKDMDEANEDKLAPHETAAVGEASGFLKELAAPESQFEEEHRMKSYHYHKSLDGIAQVKDMAEGDPSEPADETAEDFDEAAMGKGKGGRSLPRKGKGAGMDELTPGMNGETMSPEAVDPVAGKSMGRKACGEASSFFKSLSGERAFGDPHRKMCEKHFKALDDAMGGGEEPPAEETEEEFPGATMEEEEPAFEPGEMGEKGRKSLPLDKLAAAQRQQIAALAKSVTELTRRLVPQS